MKIFFYSVFVLLFPISTWAQPGKISLFGIGVIQIHQQINHKTGIAISDPYLILYSDSACALVYDIVRKPDKYMVKVFPEVNYCGAISSFCPIYICLKETSNYFHVQINEQETKYVKKADTAKCKIQITFSTYENYLKDCNYLVRKDSLSNKIRTFPNDSASEIIHGNVYDDLHPLELSGDWIKVGFSRATGKYTTEYITGWIRWRRENEFCVYRVKDD
jgi:hypothetical protein